MKITRGRVKKALKIVLYGPEGIGKSTLAAQFPGAVFIDTEGSTKEYDVARFPAPTSWQMLLDEVAEVKKNPQICRTLVIDTADWAEAACFAHVISAGQVKSIEDFGYGKGYVKAKEEFGKLLNELTEVVNAGVNVVVTAHAAMRKFEQPDEMGSYDRWEMKLYTSQKTNIAALLKEWADMVLFANYKTFAVKDKNSNKAKAQGGQRVMYTTHHPCWDAKNRHGLPDELDLVFACIAHIFGKAASAPTEPKPIDQLRALMAEAGITDAQLQKVVAEKGHYPADAAIDTYEDRFITGWCIKHFAQITNMIKEDKENV